MGKLPSFQFYPGDWLKDPQLRMTSMSSKGIWIDLICAMFEAKERGALAGTADQFCKLLGCSREEFDLFLSEARSLNFANVHEMSADCPQAIRIESRRMLRDEKQRQIWTKQKAQQRKGTPVAGESGECPQDVHLDVHEMSHRSSSSSSSLKNGDTESVAGASGLPNCKSKKATRALAHPWPDGYVLTQDMRRDAIDIASELDITLNVDREFEAWHDDCLAHGRKYTDWPAAWRNRLRGIPKFGASGINGNRNGARPQPTSPKLPTAAELEHRDRERRAGARAERSQ